MTAAERRVGEVGVVEGPVMSMNQRLEGADLVPVRMRLWLGSRMFTVVEVYTAVIPWSQRRPIDRREPRKFGKRWTRRASMGSWGRLRVAMWVEVAVVLSGNVTVMGVVVGFTSSNTDTSLMDM